MSELRVLPPLWTLSATRVPDLPHLSHVAGVAVAHMDDAGHVADCDHGDGVAAALKDEVYRPYHGLPAMSAITPNAEYWERVRARAKALGSDGCSHVSAWNLDCCLRHDVMVRTGRDMNDHAITRAEADYLFWECNRQRAQLRLSWYSPRSYVRYLGVQLGSWWKQRRHANPS